jgi:hypothetical protein
MNLIPSYFFMAPDRIRLIAVRVVSSRKSAVNDGMPGDRLGGQFARVHEYDGLAAVQVGQQRCEARVAQIAAGVAGQQYDAVGVQGVQGVLGLRDRALDVGQGQGGEQPEPARIGAYEVGGVLVDLPRPLPGLGVIAQVGTGRRNRQHAGGDAVAVHELQRGRWGPVRQVDAAGPDAAGCLCRGASQRGWAAGHADERRCGPWWS